MNKAIVVNKAVKKKSIIPFIRFFPVSLVLWSLSSPESTVTRVLVRMKII